MDDAFVRAASIAANISAKAWAVEAIETLPEGGYAFLMVVTPDETGAMVRSMVYPPTLDEVVHRGVLGFVEDHINERLAHICGE